MDTQQLRAFLEVAQARSFSGAAQHLNLTQPAISKRIALLEQYLGTELFDRIGRHVSLTEAGQALLPHARSMAQQMLVAERSVRDLAGGVSGELRLATSHHIGLHRLPPVLGHFKQAYESVQVDIEFMDSEQAFEQIHHGEVELAVVTLAPTRAANIISTTLWKDPLQFMVSTDHPLAKVTKASLQQLAEHASVLPGLNTYTGQIVKSLFDEHHLALNVSMATNYLETIRMMASVGLGWTALPASMLDSSLRTLEVPGIAMERNLGVAYHRGRSLSRAARAFLATLEDFGDRATRNRT
ncbi:MAG: LysR family transcriptional regulator [Halioglobus sp.]